MAAKDKKRYPGCLAHAVIDVVCSIVANRRQPNLVTLIYCIGTREGRVRGGGANIIIAQQQTTKPPNRQSNRYTSKKNKQLIGLISKAPLHADSDLLFLALPLSYRTAPSPLFLLVPPITDSRFPASPPRRPLSPPPFNPLTSASLDPGWAPWRVLWAFTVARAGKQSWDRFPPIDSYDYTNRV